MSKKMWSLAAAVAIVGGGLISTLPSDAAVSIPPPPPCQTQAAMTHVIRTFGGLPTQVATPGTLSAQLGRTFTTTDGRVGQEVVITNLSTGGEVNAVGTFSVDLDLSRDPGVGSIVGNQAGSQFPATQRMTAFVTANVNGQEFRSLNRVTLISTNVTSTPPAAGTVFNLANEVKFEAVDKPGEVAMVMDPGQAAVIEKH
jgi:hypothetical protein